MRYAVSGFAIAAALTLPAVAAAQTQIEFWHAFTGRLQDLPPNTKHGFHVHEVGDCSSGDGMSAKGHFNPHGKPHGHYGSPERHAGDMPNIHVPENGKLRIEVLNQMVNLSRGLLDKDGSAIVIHEGADANFFFVLARGTVSVQIKVPGQGERKKRVASIGPGRRKLKRAFS